MHVVVHSPGTREQKVGDGGEGAHKREEVRASLLRAGEARGLRVGRRGGGEGGLWHAEGNVGRRLWKDRRRQGLRRARYTRDSFGEIIRSSRRLV